MENASLSSLLKWLCMLKGENFKNLTSNLLGSDH